MIKPVKRINIKPIPWGAYKTIIVDKDITGLVSVFNEQGLITSSCCSGHVGDASTAISFRPSRDGKGFERLKKLVNSKKLNMTWEIDCNFGHCNLYLKEGIYGSNKLIASENIMDKVKKDFKIIINKLTENKK